MRRLKKKPRLIMATAALGTLLVCGFISFAFIGSSPTTMTVAYQNADFRSTATAAPTMVATDNMLVATAPAIANEPGYLQVSDIQSPSQQSQISEPMQRIVIRNATINIVVEDTEARVNEIASMATGLGGWVVSSTTSISGGTSEHPYVYGNIVVRVPADTLDSTLETIRGMAVTVNTEQITGQDVTQDYVDTSSQLRNLEAAEQQLQTIMLTASTVDDVLNVFNQLVQTRSQIEVARGRLQYYDQASAFSSITVSLSPVTLAPTPTPPPAQVGWSPLVTLNRALDSLVRASQTGVDFLITWGVYALPILLVFGLPSWMLFRQLKQRRHAKRITPIENVPPTSEVENS